MLYKHTCGLAQRSGLALSTGAVVVLQVMQQSLGEGVRVAEGEQRGDCRRDPGERAAGTYCKEWDK